MSTEKFKQRIDEIATKSQAIRAVCITPQFENGNFISSPEERVSAIASAAKADPMFEALGEDAVGVATAWGSAIEEYTNQHGQLPRDEVLASACGSLESLVTLDGAGQETAMGAMFESIKSSLSQSDGVMIRARMAGLILPTMLSSTTGDAATYIPGGKDESEIFEIQRVAGSTFGDFKEGDILGVEADGQYSGMKQTWKYSRTKSEYNDASYSFRSDDPTGTGAVTHAVAPLKPNSVVMYIDRTPVANDYPTSSTTGDLRGKWTFGGKEYNISGVVNYLKGTVERVVIGTSADSLPHDVGDKLDGKDIHMTFDVFIEKKPELIPTINHEMRSWKLRPHESILAADHTVQAYWALNREYGIDLRSMQMNQQRNWLAYEKDRRHLRDMLFSHRGHIYFNKKVTNGQYFKEVYETINQLLMGASQDMLMRTKVSGLVGIFAGRRAAAFFKSMGAPFFVPVAGYRQVPRIHFAGTVFGQWKLFEVPHDMEAYGVKLGADDCLLYARGENHTEAGYVAGDAVPATMYQHGVTQMMFDRNTLWELAYGDIHPNQGGNYFAKLTIAEYEAGKMPEGIPLN